jgi:hypothetical protein
VYLAELTASLRRRWYLLVIGLVLTAVGCLAMSRTVAPAYEVQASVLLIPPANTTSDTGNPYLYLGGLNQATDVLVRAMNADMARAPIQEAFPNVTFATERDGTTSTPIMIISVIGADPAQTMTALAAIVSSVPGELDNLQRPLAVPAGATISSMVLATDTTPTMDRKAQTRALVSVAAAGLVATVLLTGFIDRVLTNRRSRKLSGPAISGGEDDSTHAPYLTRAITIGTTPEIDSTTAVAGELQPLEEPISNQLQGDPADDNGSAVVADNRRGRHSAQRVSDSPTNSIRSRIRG